MGGYRGENIIKEMDERAHLGREVGRDFDISEIWWEAEVYGVDRDGEDFGGGRRQFARQHLVSVGFQEIHFGRIGEMYRITTLGGSEGKKIQLRFGEDEMGLQLGGVPSGFRSVPCTMRGNLQLENSFLLFPLKSTPSV